MDFHDVPFHIYLKNFNIKTKTNVIDINLAEKTAEDSATYQTQWFIGKIENTSSNEKVLKEQSTFRSSFFLVSSEEPGE